MKIASLLLLPLTFLLIFHKPVLSKEGKTKRPSPAAQVSQQIGKTHITIDYSQPAVNDRKIWGELVPYDEVWRTGANEATWFEINKAVNIEGASLPAGKYGFFTVPGKKEWTIIFNKVWDQWGAYNYESSEDALRIQVAPVATKDLAERLTFQIQEDGKIELAWENLLINFKLEIAE